MNSKAVFLISLACVLLVVFSSLGNAGEVAPKLNARVGSQKVDQRIRSYRLTVTKVDEQDKTEALQTTHIRDTGSAVQAQVRSEASDLRAQKTRRVAADE